MKYQYLKLSQIIILSLVALFQFNYLIYVGTLLAALLTHQKHAFSSLLALLLTSLTLWTSIEIWKFVIIALMLVFALLSTKLAHSDHLSVKYLVPVFLLTLSLISINQNQLIRIVQLLIFFAFLLLTYYCHESKLKTPLYLACFVLILQGTVLAFYHFVQLQQPQQPVLLKSSNHQWWYFLTFPFAIQCASFIIQSLKAISNSHHLISKEKSKQNIEIEMTQIQRPQSRLIEENDSGIEMQEYFKNIEMKTDSDNKKISQTKKVRKTNNSKSEEKLQKCNEKEASQSESDSSQQTDSNPNNTISQSQNLNMILILPFLAQQAGILELPLIAYIFSIHYNKNSPYFYFLMLLTNFIIIFLQKDNQSTIDNALLLRISIVLLVNKNIHVLTEVTEIVKKIWLRSSFVLVLAFLFWFSLKTVNIFHIILTIILLIFISAKNAKNQHSYRHKNWVYLLSLFNIFLVGREIYHLAILYGLYKQGQYSLFQNVLDLTGISHEYQPQSRFFNFIPLIVSVFMGFQYLTYQSRIYNKVRQRPILPIYQAKIHELIKLFTIIYYKIIPWMSYVFIFSVILVLEFSCTSLILLIWLLISLAVQVQRKNEPRTFQIMYSLWSILQRLFAIQIILRYTFEFLNFPMFYGFFHSLPFFQTIQYYKQFLGLAIREGDYVYFKAITKFQLMIGLDFICIFISFLVIEYYTYLLAYHEIENPNAAATPLGRAIEKDVIKEIYGQYIDFKLTLYFRKFTVWLKRASKLFLWLYYPALGIYCCFFPSLITFIFLLVGIRFYLTKNSQSYEKFINQNLILKVKDLFNNWKEEITGRQLYEYAANIYEIMIDGRKSIRFDELVSFEKLRKYLVLVSSLGIVLNYASRVFELNETAELFGAENVFSLLKLRWIFYVGGVSIDSHIEMFQLLVILGSTILEVKCTRFLLRLYDLSARNQQPSKYDRERHLIEQNEAYITGEQTLYENLLEYDKKSDKELKQQLEQMQELQDADFNPALKKQIQSLKSDHFYDEDRPYDSGIIFKRKQEPSIVPMPRQSEKLQLEVSKKQLKKFIEMKVSLLQGVTKFVERCFVMVLVFLSIVENRHPFSIAYLVCSMLLTFWGATSILGLSRVIAFLIVLEYLLIMANYANYNLMDSGVPQFKQNFQSERSFEFITSSIPQEWEEYLTFGDTSSELIMMILSWVILFSYQLYFAFLNKSWEQILDSLAKKMTLSKIEKKVYEYSNLIYTYFLIYSPLVITLCSLGIYLLDFTITNLMLTVVSILFLFKSVLWQEYSGSRQFWRLYFYVLQFFIVIFMLIYNLLSIPMYQDYCIKFLCSPEEFHTKVYKAGLLFVLQIGIDLTKSTYFINALDNLKVALTSEVMFSKMAIAYKENDRKINKKFRQMNQEKSLENHLVEVEQFLEKYKNQPDVAYQNKKQIILSSKSWMDILLETLPNFVDSTLVLTSQQAREFVSKENAYWMMYKEIDEDDLELVDDQYLNEFAEVQDFDKLIESITQIRQEILQSLSPGSKLHQKRLQHSAHNINDNDYSHGDCLPTGMMRKSFSQNILPCEPESLLEQRLENVRESLIVSNQPQQQKRLIEKQEKTKLIFLLILESIVSNWHYLTYFLLVFEHLHNMGALTCVFPITVFCYGLIYSYQPPKNLWMVNFLLILIPIAFKFSIAIGLIHLSDEVIHLLIGDSPSSILIEFLIIFAVLIQCLILKVIGLYEEGVTKVQPMKFALIRNMINNDNQTEISHLALLLKDSMTIPQNSVEFMFSRTQQKAGYSYTTLMTSLQLTTLFFVFLFYDQMAIRKEVTIYEMISYNQFTAGMVILTLIQLAFILIERFIHISDFKEYCQKWELNLVLKFAILIINLIYVEVLVLVFFPLNSNNFTNNFYISCFYVLNALAFLVSALQIKYGIDQKSKGFMDSYTWYNGYIYTAFRAVPFLFEFKVFSDWTFTKTALRLFDWIKLEQIFGRMYVAKCNSIFLQGKVIGSRIQWWKKLLMGFPLLFAIILLIFGPLILFSSLNPLASKNSISAGYLELCLKVNRTNEYVFYTNSHITDIVNLVPNESQKDILQSYDIDQDSVQVINLQAYSDQYWQISQGSYLKLLEEPSQSQYEFVIRMKFERNQTGSTPTYTVSTFELPLGEVQNFKQTLEGKKAMALPNFLNNFLRLDNNNGIHFLGDQKLTIKFLVQQAKKNPNKKYWIIENGLKMKIASDKYTKAIFGYSVMSFYISIILVIANYFRFLFQGSTNTIILNDIPFADPVLSMCNGVYKARRDGNTEMEERLFWLIIDLLRSPDEIKSLTGSYLDARMETKQNEKLQEGINNGQSQEQSKTKNQDGQKQSKGKQLGKGNGTENEQKKSQKQRKND